MDEISEGIKNSPVLGERMKEVPTPREPHVIVAVVIPVVVDVHATLVDVEFDAVLVGERWLPIPVRITGDRGLLPCGLYPLSPAFYSGAAPRERDTSARNEQEVPASKPTRYRAP